jgi:hypothetical protein
LAMGEHDDEELQRAFRMSLQPAPDAKRSKPRDVAAAGSTESPEALDRRVQRELRAAAAEQRRLSALGTTTPGTHDPSSSSLSLENTLAASPIPKLPDRSEGLNPLRDTAAEKTNRGKRRVEDERQQLPLRTVEQLYTLVFGTKVSKDVLSQWCHQGFRFDFKPSSYFLT